MSYAPPTLPLDVTWEGTPPYTAPELPLDVAWEDATPLPTKSRPTASLLDGNWLPLSGSDLAAMINSEAVDLNTYIYAEGPTTTRMEMGDAALPVSDRTLRYYAEGIDGGLKVRLYQGDTLIAERTHVTLPETTTQFTMTLTEGEHALLTDGTDMFVELETIVVRLSEAGEIRVTEDDQIRLLG